MPHFEGASHPEWPKRVKNTSNCVPDIYALLRVDYRSNTGQTVTKARETAAEKAKTQFRKHPFWLKRVMFSYFESCKHVKF